MSKEKQQDDHSYSPPKIGSIVQTLVISTVTGTLLVPVLLLFLVKMSNLMIAFMSAGFIFLFTIILTVVAQGRIYEIFVGSAT